MCGNRHVSAGRCGEHGLGRTEPSLCTWGKHGLSQEDFGHRPEWAACCTQEILDNGSGSIDPGFRGKLAPEASLSRENCVN